MNTSTQPQTMTHARRLDRARELGRIHLLKRDLELPEDAYRAVLACLTGKHSAADLGSAERKSVIDFMARELAHKRRAATKAEVVSDEEALAILG